MSSAGQTLVDERALDTVRRLLLPIATVITPNVAEAAALLGIERVENPTDILAALAALCGGGTTVVLTGGDTARGSQAIDRVRLADGRHLSLETPWVTTRCDHGTGCTFSAAIAAAMALDQPVEAALHSAKTYLSRALRTARPVGAGRGPVDHLWALRSDMRDSDD